MLIKILKGRVTTSCNICQGEPNTSQYQVIGRTTMTLKNGENEIFSLLKLVNRHIRLFPPLAAWYGARIVTGNLLKDTIKSIWQSALLYMGL